MPSRCCPGPVLCVSDRVLFADPISSCRLGYHVPVECPDPVRLLPPCSSLQVAVIEICDEVLPAITRGTRNLQTPSPLNCQETERISQPWRKPVNIKCRLIHQYPHVPKPGLWCPAVTFLDPATDEADFNAQTKYYHYLSRSGLTGLAILGTNSETMLLTREERALLLHIARTAVSRTQSSHHGWCQWPFYRAGPGVHL